MSRKILAAFAVIVALAATTAYAHAPLTCSPGYWKNHLLEAHGPNPALCPSASFEIDCSNTLGWGLPCANHPVCTCEELVFFLSAELGATEQERVAAQTCLNLVGFEQLPILAVCND